MLLLIDNYDSFTHCIARYFKELGQHVLTVKHDAISLNGIEDLNPEYIVISPGPCTPDEAGISLDVIHHFKQRIPILGVCLGHQAIVQSFGGIITRAPVIMHAKTSVIEHNSKGMFKSLPSHFLATRYHSLVAENYSLPDCLEVTAWATERYYQDQKEVKIKTIMAVKHRTLPIEGVQFHPESVLSEYGHQLFDGFLNAYRTRS